MVRVQEFLAQQQEKATLPADRTRRGVSVIFIADTELLLAHQIAGGLLVWPNNQLQH